MQEENSRIETEREVKDFIDKLQYALSHGAKIKFQINRFVDENRDEKYTNRYTVGKLFPDENPVEVLKRELQTLTVENYIRTVKDIKFPKRSEMREFGKEYNGTEDVYIKIRLELFGEDGNPLTFVMSFHFAEKPFNPEMFPYKKNK